MPTLKPKPTKRLTGKAKDLLLKLPKEWQGVELILEIQPSELTLRRTDQMTEWRKLKGAGRSITQKDIDEMIRTVRVRERAWKRLIQAPKGIVRPSVIAKEIEAYRKERRDRDGRR